MDYIPPSINVVENGERLILERRWFNMSALGLIIFGVVWNAFVILYARQSVVNNAPAEEMLLVIPGGIVGLIAAYLALAAALNRTRFTLDQQTLSVAHAPLPWPGKTIPRNTLQQIMVKRYTTKSSPSGKVSRRHTTFAVLAKLADGKQKRLVGDLPGSADALYIKQALHQHMGLDVPLAEGEYHP